MITRLRVKNFRSFIEGELELAPLTVLVGPNAAGKSNLLYALHFLRDAFRSGLDVAMRLHGGLNGLRTWPTHSQRLEDLSIEVELRIADLQARYRLVLGHDRESTWRVKEEVCDFLGDSGPGLEIKQGKWVRSPKLTAGGTGQARTLALPLLTDIDRFRLVYNFLVDMGFYTITPEDLMAPQELGDPVALADNASNLASVLIHLKEKTPNRAAALEDVLSRLVSGVEGYEILAIGDYLAPGLHHRKTGESGVMLSSLRQESDGTIRLFALLTALYQQPPRTLIALEEPEMMIHTGALAVLWEELRRASAESQILITTHSPDLLDMCDADSLRVVENRDGLSYVGPVVPEQKAIIRERLMSAGQLMRGQGLYRAETE
jgi:predicted ATPase